MNIAQLERDLEAKRQEGLALLTKTCTAADAANREWTDEERAALKTIETDATAIKTTLQRAASDREIGSALERLQVSHAPTVSGRTVLTPPTRFASMGEQFVTSEQYKFFKDGKHRTTSAWRSESLELFDRGGMRAATLTEDPASGGALVIPQYLPGIQAIPTKRLVVADLMASGTTDSNTVHYMREKTWTNAANSVAEGAAKPESTLTFEGVAEPVRKIAHWLPVTEEMLEDVAQIRSYLDARLRLGVEIEEEDQLLNGTVVPPDIVGLLNRAGLAADVVVGVAPDNAIEGIFRQIMAIFSTSFLQPDGIVLNPADWAQIVTTKTSQGAYLAISPFGPVQTPILWGLPVVVTPSIVANTGLVGAFKTASQVFRRGGIRVEASNSHQDYFIKNLVAIRAEERLALAVYRPGAFGKVTGI